MSLTTTIQHEAESINVTLVSVRDLSLPGGGALSISADANNRAQLGTDGGVYVSDELTPNPLAYYILAKA